MLIAQANKGPVHRNIFR